MTIADVVRQLNEQKISVYLEDGKLKTKSSKDALTPAAVALIKQHKEDLLQFLSRSSQVTPGTTGQPIPRVARDMPVYPLAFAQQRLWFIDQLAADQSQYIISNALLCRGQLEPAALQYAFDQILQRHEVLRTIYQTEAEQPVQRVLPVQTLPVQTSQLLEVDPDRELQQIRQLLAAEASRPFVLSCDLMLRVQLIRLLPAQQEQRHLLLISMHHIASDGWSSAVLTRELMHFYQQALTGQAGEPLAELPCQYLDYACWQRQLLQNGTYQQQLQFWQQQLAQLPAVHGLPLDRPRAAVASQAGAVVSQWVPAALTEQLHALAQQQGVTLFMLLQTAFALLVGRWSRESDVVLGTPVAGRQHPSLEPLIGFFVNTLVLRSELQWQWSFSQLLQQNKQMILQSFSNQDVPFETLVEQLQPERSTSYSPLFQLMFALQNHESVALELPGLQLSAVAGTEQSSKFELNLVCAHDGEQINCYWNFRTELFEAQTIRAMADSFVVLLEAIVGDVQGCIGDYPLLNSVQQQALLRQQPAAMVPVTGNMAQLLLGWARQQPQAIALIETRTGRQLSYQQLVAQASGLAVRLQQQYQPGDKVAIYLPRQNEQIIAALAVLLAGLCYVPLDIQSPDQRCSYILADSAAVCVLTTAALAQKVAELAAVPAICCDDLSELPADVATLNTPSHGETPAIVIYTSGSTGKPKGVLLSHNNVLHLVSQQQELQVTAQDCCTHAANFAFDASTVEVWSTLSSGARLVLVDHETYIYPARLKACYLQYGVTVAFVTTAVLNQIAAELPDAFQSLRMLAFGGERVDATAVSRILQAGAPELLLHCYGPTENTTYSTFYPVTEHRQHDYPIGRGLPGGLLFVLDERRQLVPAGMPGELYVGGAGISLGYHGQDALTAQAFVAVPAVHSGLLYKTGDLVRLDAQGQLCYLSRVDDQVKLRGFRIEPAEISHALTLLDDIDEAVVVLAGSGEHAFLAAYVSSVSPLDDAEFIRRCRQHCTATLPDYMRPAVIVRLEALPKNANGKIDKKALPLPQSPVQEYVAARTPTEQQLCGIWQQLLKVERVGIHDHFFQLGGHSLLATRLTSHIRQHFGVELPLHVLFNAPQLHVLATYLDALLLNTQPMTPAADDAEEGFL